MTPKRSYLLKAFYEWLVDNQLTPLLLVDATVPQVQVPKQYVSDGKIVLNISPKAIDSLEMSHESIRFNVCFAGKPYSVVIPMIAALGIHARENGEGTFFPIESSHGVSSILEMFNQAPPKRADGRPMLRIVK